jgi:hypothetical protein
MPSSRSGGQFLVRRFPLLIDRRDASRAAGRMITVTGDQLLSKSPRPQTSLYLQVQHHCRPQLPPLMASFSWTRTSIIRWFSGRFSLFRFLCHLEGMISWKSSFPSCMYIVWSPSLGVDQVQLQLQSQNFFGFQRASRFQHSVARSYWTRLSVLLHSAQHGEVQPEKDHGQADASRHGQFHRHCPVRV